jgi:hypothetical protein
MTYIFYAILLYLLYRFVVGFLLPVIRTTSQVKKQFNAMKEQMEGARQAAGQQQHAHAYNNQSDNSRTTINSVNQKPKYDIEGEYISFEENPK